MTTIQAIHLPKPRSRRAPQRPSTAGMKPWLRDFAMAYAGEGFYQIGEVRLRLG